MQSSHQPGLLRRDRGAGWGCKWARQVSLRGQEDIHIPSPSIICGICYFFVHPMRVTPLGKSITDRSCSPCRLGALGQKPYAAWQRPCHSGLMWSLGWSSQSLPLPLSNAKGFAGCPQRSWAWLVMDLVPMVGLTSTQEGLRAWESAGQELCPWIWVWALWMVKLWYQPQCCPSACKSWAPAAGVFSHPQDENPSKLSTSPGCQTASQPGPEQLPWQKSSGNHSPCCLPHRKYPGRTELFCLGCRPRTAATVTTVTLPPFKETLENTKFRVGSILRQRKGQCHKWRNYKSHKSSLKWII